VAEEHGEPGFVLSTPTGHHLEPEALDRAWRRAQKAAGVVHRRIHDLRHHAISRWITAWWTPKEVQAAAGHASITTTFDRYGHLMPNNRAHQRERLAALRGTQAHLRHTAPDRPTAEVAPNSQKPRVSRAFRGAPERT